MNILLATLRCGVDEAGRGPLAGAVFAAAVILNHARPIAGLADSKILSAKKRELLAVQIKTHALAWSVATASVHEIDQINILQASLLAMHRAVDALGIRPTEVWVDGLYCPPINLPVKAIVKGDTCIAQISAASILAKTARDAEMLQMHQRFPQYGFDQHKGYPTAAHLLALKKHGVSPIHRRSFAPVRALINKFRSEV